MQGTSSCKPLQMDVVIVVMSVRGDHTTREITRQFPTQLVCHSKGNSWICRAELEVRQPKLCAKAPSVSVVELQHTHKSPLGFKLLFSTFRCELLQI